jgi:NADH/NAD ratio-sensing transcriptional regulator Rex
LFHAKNRCPHFTICYCIIRNIRELEGGSAAGTINIGIIAVPASCAQHVADMLTGAGVMGLLNLTMCDIHAPAGVAVVDARLILDLLKLSFRIKYHRCDRVSVHEPERGEVN